MLSSEDRAAIEVLHHAWLDAELRGDSPALLQLCAEVPVWIPPNEPPLCGRTAILRWLGNQPEATVLQIDIEDLEISGSGSFAWKLATFRTTLECPADAGPRIVTGSHGWLLQRDDAGAWRVNVVTWTIG
jgi:ketosteroid isomerase-like protein